MKYVYIKNGDVVEQLQRIGSPPEEVPPGGPDAFIADFLHMVSGHPTLLISRDARSAELRLGTVQARVFDLCPTCGLASRACRAIWIFLVVLLQMLRFRPGRIICGRPGAMLWATYIVSRVYSIPFVHSRHVSNTDARGSLIKRAMSGLDNWVIRRANAVVCHGPFTRQQIVESGMPASRVFEFDVAYPELASPRADSGDADNGNGVGPRAGGKILYLGRLQEGKGVLDLLDACAPLLRADRDLSLVYIGDGPAFATLEERVAAEGLQSQVRLQGRVPHRVVGEMLKDGTLLVTPTRQAKEGRCMAAMEALTVGIPIVAPNGGPFPFLIEHGENGLLYAVDSIEELRSQLQTALRDPALYERLRQGAQESGRKLREAPVTFSMALEQGFLRAA